jgi:hypothetical protein
MWSTGTAHVVFNTLQTLCLGRGLANGHDAGYWNSKHMCAHLSDCDAASEVQ